MTPGDPVQGMIERLSRINWERPGHHAWSRKMLLKEYLRRVAQWARTVDSDARLPFFDIARCLDPTVQVDPEPLAGLRKNLEAKGAGWNVDQVVPHILRWQALKSRGGHVSLPDLPDPFEPLILMFERGGGFHTENGEVNLEYLSFPLRGWRDRHTDPPVVDFDVASLDSVDREGSIRQFGREVAPL